MNVLNITAVCLVVQMFMYNAVGGKLNRGMAVYDTVAALKGGVVDTELAFKANVLGWCIELVSWCGLT